MTDNELFEYKAKVFYKMTNLMAPGKSVPPGMVDEPSLRYAVWGFWDNINGPQVEQILRYALDD